MNRRQKLIIRQFVFVVAITTIFVVVMINVKDFINKSEAMRTTELLAKNVLQYREQFGSLPLHSYIARQREILGDARLGQLQYRAQWINFDDPPDTILAYSQKDYRFLVGNGFIVMYLDGRVEWMRPDAFNKLLRAQQTRAEMEMPAKEVAPPQIFQNPMDF